MNGAVSYVNGLSMPPAFGVARQRTYHPGMVALLVCRCCLPGKGAPVCLKRCLQASQDGRTWDRQGGGYYLSARGYLTVSTHPPRFFAIRAM